MEWQLSKSFTREIDGYDGYGFTGFMDGYVGNMDYDLDYFVTLSISDVYTMRRTSAEKLEYYSAIEEPDDKTTRRIARLTENLTKYNEIVVAVEEMDGY